MFAKCVICFKCRPFSYWLRILFSQHLLLGPVLVPTELMSLSRFFLPNEFGYALRHINSCTDDFMVIFAMSVLKRSGGDLRFHPSYRRSPTYPPFDTVQLNVELDRSFGLKVDCQWYNTRPLHYIGIVTRRIACYDKYEQESNLAAIVYTLNEEWDEWSNRELGDGVGNQLAGPSHVTCNLDATNDELPTDRKTFVVVYHYAVSPTAEYNKMMVFKSGKDAVACMSQLEQMKYKIPDEGKLKDIVRWIRCVIWFRNEWGDEYLPEDIRQTARDLCALIPSHTHPAIPRTINFGTDQASVVTSL